MSFDIYTDGSYSQYNDTSGFGVFCKETPLLSTCGSRSNVGDSGCAEYTAIEAAIELVLEYPGNIDIVYIRTDYKSAVDAFGNGTIGFYGSYTSKRVQKSISRLLEQCRGRGINVCFVKVRAHSGIAGNEIADRFAHIARLFGVNSNTPYFQNYTKALTKDIHTYGPYSTTFWQLESGIGCLKSIVVPETPRPTPPPTPPLSPSPSPSLYPPPELTDSSAPEASTETDAPEIPAEAVKLISDSFDDASTKVPMTPVLSSTSEELHGVICEYLEAPDLQSGYRQQLLPVKRGRDDQYDSESDREIEPESSFGFFKYACIPLYCGLVSFQE